ncbi:MAG: SHOCT domain-containing protein [Bacteroidales bacterium]|nr:SHOCT domain-containing protein [Bacteroidales bacterium]
MIQEEQINQLMELKKLLDAGVLSEDEFAKEKAEIMNPTKRQPSSDGRPSGPVGGPKRNRLILPIALGAVGLVLVALIMGGFFGGSRKKDYGHGRIPGWETKESFGDVIKRTGLVKYNDQDNTRQKEYDLIMAEVSMTYYDADGRFLCEELGNELKGAWEDTYATYKDIRSDDNEDHLHFERYFYGYDKKYLGKSITGVSDNVLRVSYYDSKDKFVVSFSSRLTSDDMAYYNLGLGIGEKDLLRDKRH